MSNQPFNPFEVLTTPWGKLPLGNSPASGNSSLDEMDKRINELKTVEQWLTLNLNLLKTTIQGLEIQRGTLAAIAAFSQSVSGTDASKSSTTANPFTAASGSAQGSPPPGMKEAAWWWNSMQEQFGQMMNAAQAMVTATPAPGSKESTGSSKTKSSTSGEEKK